MRSRIECMSAALDDVAAAQAIAGLTAAIDALLALRLTSLPLAVLPALGRSVETQLRRMPSFDQAWIAELDRRDAPFELGAKSVAAILVDTLRVTPGHARARVKAAANLGPRFGFTGEPLAPLFPLVVAAQIAGAISIEHALVVTDTIDALPDAVQAEHSTAVEAALVDHAYDFHPMILRGLAHRLSDHLDPDGTLTTEHDRRRLRALTLTPRSDGSAHLSGDLTAGCTATWQTILDALTKPSPAADGQRDPRTAAQRTHDAFHDAGQRVLRTGDLPDSGGTPATVIITMTLNDLEARAGQATTEHGGGITIAEALRIAAEADVIPVVLNDAGGIIAHGRTRRTASPAQRFALTARDGGCSFPGCDTPPAWTQAHHIVAWADGGLTNLENLTLICGFHHREFERQGWVCDLIDRVPWWTPPTWIDPAQTGRRNETHHLDRLLPTPLSEPAQPATPTDPETPDVPPTRKNSTGPRSRDLITNTPTRIAREPQLTELQT